MQKDIDAAISHALLQHHHHPTAALTYFPVSGGSINKCYQIKSGSKQWFGKINSALLFPQLFEKEQAGLTALAKGDVIKVPETVACFESESQQILLLEWIKEGNRSHRFWSRFGAQLAGLHRVSADTFGWHENNYMGSVPQCNEPADNWIGFFIYRRLLPLLQSCDSKERLPLQLRVAFDALFKKLPQIFNDAEKPSLLHGDLWAGNFLCDEGECPVLIDPAVYYGHRSVDLAMTTLFGGFHPPFYEAYHHHFPFPENYKEQWKICNLYPLLIHLYLFGSSYLASIEATLNEFN